MPPKEKTFVSFRCLSPSDPEYTPHCPAITGKGLRCTSRLQECNVPRIKELLTKLQDGQEDAIENETREDVLREIARLSICGYQKKSIETAVRQWVDDIQPPDRHSVGPQTPQAPQGNANAQSRDNRGGFELIFTPFRREEIETPDADELSRKPNRIMDENIGAKFLKHLCESKAEGGYLYIFECAGAKGMYKVGRTTRPMKRGAEQEKCYSNIVERRSIHCPNAELVEKIIHLQFAHCRYQHHCHCNKFHTEWFKAPYDDIFRHIQLWSHFSRALQGGDTSAKLSQVTIPLPGTSSDPDRWCRWALRYIEMWKKGSPVLNLIPPGETAANKASGIEDLEDPGLVAGLRSSNSTPGTPGDGFTDHSTPTPSSQTRSMKFATLETLSIPPAAPSESDDVYFTPTEYVRNMPSTPTPTSTVRSAGFNMELPFRQKGPQKPCTT